jgi:hypothetical protein
MSKIEVDTVEPQSGTSLTLGASGDTITIPSGATFDSSAATTTLPATVVTTTGTQTLSNKTIDATQLTDSTVTLAKLSATGTQDATTFLRGDNTFQTIGANTPLFYVYASAGNTSFSQNTLTKVTLNNESYDSGSFFDITTNYRFLPTIAGKYLFIGQAYIDYTAGAPTTLSANIRLNNASSIATSGYNSGSGYGARNMSGIVNMNGSTDYIELFVYSNSTTPYYTGGQYNTWLTGFKIIE